ncbi:hypothetical protein R1flu_014078 [Riccia fluitans]|uniref:DNA mismatch repair proteins mutS family domain-containing protein n=1 Tax=Riccia fluitans TaxID=41844 RepID=A0ABD1YIT5_9MARC
MKTRADEVTTLALVIFIAIARLTPNTPFLVVVEGDYHHIYEAVPAQECRLSIADGVYTRVGSVDDLAAGQSTFKVKMSETAAILEKATPQSLVLLDEGTEWVCNRATELLAKVTDAYGREDKMTGD